MELYAEITLEVTMKPKRGQSLFIPSRDGKRGVFTSTRCLSCCKGQELEVE